MCKVGGSHPGKSASTAFAVSLYAMAEHAVELENGFSAARGIAHHGKVANQIPNLLWRKFVLPRRHVRRPPYGVASLANDLNVELWGAGSDGQMQARMESCRPPGAVACFAMTECAISLKDDRAPNQRFCRFRVYSLTRVLRHTGACRQHERQYH